MKYIPITCVGTYAGCDDLTWVLLWCFPLAIFKHFFFLTALRSDTFLYSFSIFFCPWSSCSGLFVMALPSWRLLIVTLLYCTVWPPCVQAQLMNIEKKKKQIAEKKRKRAEEQDRGRDRGDRDRGRRGERRGGRQTIWHYKCFKTMWCMGGGVGRGW